MIWRYVTPRWRTHLEWLLERERDVDAVFFFTVPMSHFRGIPHAPARALRRAGRLLRRGRADEPAGVRRHGHGLQLLPRRRSGEYDLVVSNSEGGLDRLRELGARRAEAVFWARRPRPVPSSRRRQGARRLLLRLRRQVPARVDADARRRAVAARAGDRLRARRPRLPRRHRQRAADRRRAVQRLRARDLGGARQPQRHAPLPRDASRLVDCRPFELAAAGAAIVSNPSRGWSAGSSPGASCSSSSTREEAVDAYRELLADPAQAEEMGRRARERVLDEHTYAHRARQRARARRASSGRWPRRVAESARIAIVPAFNEEGAIGGVIDEIRAYDAGLEIVVVDDGSTRSDGRGRARTPARACCACRSISASAAPCRPAFATRTRTASSSPCASTATASTIRRSSTRWSRRCCAASVDIAVGSRYLGARATATARRRRGGSASGSSRHVVSLLTRQRITDPTSGFQALNRKAITLFAADYPHDYPEVEALVLVVRHRLRLCEVPDRDAAAHGRAVLDPRRCRRSTTW